MKKNLNKSGFDGFDTLPYATQPKPQPGAVPTHPSLVDETVKDRNRREEVAKMARTALEMSADELKQYKPFSRKRQGDEFLFQQAWEVARQAASLLHEKFDAKRVLVFGSLLHRERFTHGSDIDIAVWGIPPEKFFKAVAKMIDLSPQFQIDLVSAEYCSERMRQKIEKEGVAV